MTMIPLRSLLPLNFFLEEKEISQTTEYSTAAIPFWRNSRVDWFQKHSVVVGRSMPNCQYSSVPAPAPPPTADISVCLGASRPASRIFFSREEYANCAHHLSQIGLKKGGNAHVLHRPIPTVRSNRQIISCKSSSARIGKRMRLALSVLNIWSRDLEADVYLFK